VALTILLADDSVPAQNMGKKILCDAGYDVLTVGNGLEALRKIAETVPDIAILDIFMPGYSGLELCQKLRASTATAALPVILTVGKLEPYRPEDGESVHSNAVIVKPFAAAELISAVRSLIGGPPAATEAVTPAHVQAATESDPLQDATAGSAEPVAFDSPASGSGQMAGAVAEEPADEPLFSFGESAANQIEPAQPMVEQSVYGAEPLLSDFESGGAESLRFNPDAERTPFSASATDLLSSEPQSPAESEESPFTEFDLESAPSAYSGAEEPVISATEAPISAANIAQGIADSPLPAPDPVIIPEAGAPVSGDASAQESSVFEIGESPEQIITDAPLEFPVEPIPAPAAELLSPELLSPEEETRRQAFEDLFNATELPPLEEPVVAAEATGPIVASDMLPNIAGPSREPFDVVPDSELEPLNDREEPSAVSAEPDPYLLEEEEPRNAVGDIPDRDAMLDDGLETNWRGSAAAVVEHPAEELLTPSFEQYPFGVGRAAEPDELSPLTDVAPSTDSIPVEAQAVEPEPLPASPEVVPSEAEPLAAEPVHVEPLETHPSFAGLAAPLPTFEHVVESELEHAPVASEPVQHEAEPEPAAAISEPVQPEPVATAPEPTPLEPEPEPVAAAHEAVQPTPETHASLAGLAGVASAAGVAAALPTVAHLVEAVESELKHELAPAGPVLPEPIAVAPEPAQPEPAPEPVAAAPEPVIPEPPAVQPVVVSPPSPAPVAAETISRSSEAERVHQAVERVFDRFKPLLVAAIVRELARHD